MLVMYNHNQSCTCILICIFRDIVYLYYIFNYIYLILGLNIKYISYYRYILLHIYNIEYSSIFILYIVLLLLDLMFMLIFISITIFVG